MPDYKKLVAEEESIQTELEKRWIQDEDLLYLVKYVMKDSEGKDVPDIINVTLNRAAVFAANIIAAQGTTSEQRIVETDDKNFDTTYVEDFQKAAFASANDRLRRQGKTQINPFFDTQLSIRGRAAARCIFQMGKDENGIDILIPDIALWDSRFVTYRMGENGLAWAAYKTRRPKASIEAEYGIVITGKEALVLDVWDTEHSEIWIDGKRHNDVKDKKKMEQEHSFRFTPVVVQIVPLGYGTILLSENSIKNEGESIFFLIRDVIPERNRLASIMQTLNLKTVKPPATWESETGETNKSIPEYEDAMGMASMTAADKGGGPRRIDFGDAQRSATIAMALFDDAIGEGSLSSADLGTIGSPPASGIRAIIAGENRDQVVRPRLEAKALLNKSLAEMFTRQVIQIGGSVELGTLGHKRTFETSKLKGEYETTYKYTAKSPVTDAGLYSLAASAGDSLSGKYKLEKIYQLDDPDGEDRQKRWEEAEKLSPTIKINRTIMNLLEMAKRGDKNAEFEAELLSAEMGIDLKQRLAGEISQTPKPEPVDEPTQVLSLFGGQGGGASQGTPKEE